MVERVEMGGAPAEEGINPVAPPENVFPQDDAPAASSQPEGSRPEWLPEQFQDPQALADAYSELRSKMDAGADGQADPATEEDGLVLSSETLEKYSEKYYTEGLDENDYAELNKLGVSKELVGQYAAGMSALMNQQTNSVYAEVGGQEQYQTMIDWARTSLSAQESEAFDKAVLSGNQDTVMMAVKGLSARYAETNGKEATLVQGATQASGEGNFSSAAQISDAMKDPRYERDPAYRAEVLRKMQNSSVV